MTLETQNIVVKHVTENAEPKDRYKLEVERTSAGKHKIMVQVYHSNPDTLLDLAFGILEEAKSRLGIEEEE